MFGSTAADIVAEKDRSAREHAQELRAAGLSIDDELEEATRLLEDERRGAQGARWN